MATNIDKALYQAPASIEELAQDEEPIEIEIIDPEQVNIHAGGLDLSIIPGEDEDSFAANIAEDLSEGELATLASDLSEDITTHRVGEVLRAGSKTSRTAVRGAHGAVGWRVWRVPPDDYGSRS
jgi:hypothetical protein